MDAIEVGFIHDRLDPEVAALVGSLVFAVLATPAVLALLRRFGVFDIPSARSVHDQPTLRGAGWVVVIGACVGWLIPVSSGPVRWWLPSTAVAFAAIGFRDDIRSMSAHSRLLLQVAVTVGAVSAAAVAGVIDLHPMWLLIAAFVLVSYVNAFNFMDGVNAVSALQAIVVGGFLAFEGAGAGSGQLQVAGLVLVGASLGFLPFNAIGAVCFLGDVGSYFMGAWLAASCILAIDVGVDPVTVAALMAVYAADTATTLVSRIRRREQWWESHRDHVYQRLLDAGTGHLGSAAIVSASTAICAAIGSWADGRNGLHQLIALGGVAAVCAGYVSLPGLLGRVPKAVVPRVEA